MSVWDWVFYGAMGVTLVGLLGLTVALKLHTRRWEREQLPRIQQEQQDAIRAWARGEEEL